jgi:hypothetical protein
MLAALCRGPHPTGITMLAIGRVGVILVLLGHEVVNLWRCGFCAGMRRRCLVALWV